MRELVVTLEYNRGVDPVMNVFVDHPQLVSKAVDVSLGPWGLTRVDRLSGPESAIDELVGVYLDPSVCNECAAPDGRCDAGRSYEVLADGARKQTVYSFHKDVSFCNSVPYYAATHLTPGVLFDSQRRGPDHEWRLLMRDDEGVGEMYDALVEGVPEDVTVSFERLRQLDRWGEHTGTIADLSPEQREAIEEAVDQDYYATPRQATLADISTALGVPQSTVRYRLRRAEAWLTDTVVTGQQLADRPISSSAD